eukprot:120279-Lingulodinium_polyedra.AAC.1
MAATQKCHWRIRNQLTVEVQGEMLRWERDDRCSCNASVRAVRLAAMDAATAGNADLKSAN